MEEHYFTVVSMLPSAVQVQARAVAVVLRFIILKVAEMEE